MCVYICIYIYISCIMQCMMLMMMYVFLTNTRNVFGKRRGPQRRQSKEAPLLSCEPRGLSGGLGSRQPKAPGTEMPKRTRLSSHRETRVSEAHASRASARRRVMSQGARQVAPKLKQRKSKASVTPEVKAERSCSRDGFLTHPSHSWIGERSLARSLLACAGLQRHVQATCFQVPSSLQPGQQDFVTVESARS